MAGSIMAAVAAPLIGGAVSSIVGGGQNKGGGQAAAAADPFASQRGQYQQQLSQLMTDPNSFQMSSAAQFAERQGMQGEEAQMAARGLSNSGAEKAALTQYATGFAGQQYQQQMSNLMTLSGATAGNTGAAANAIQQGTTANNQAISTFGNTVGNAVTNSNTFQQWMGNTGDAANTPAYMQ